MLFPIKAESEILQEMIQEVVEATGITNMTAGSIARTLLEVFNKRLNTCYKYLDIYTSMSFLSTAEGIYLDAIGALLGCTRVDLNETDTNYRYRISQQVFTMAAGNRTSIRLKCLVIPEVKDIIITPYSRGNGSFTVHVLTDEVDTPDDVLAAVEAVVMDAKAEGIKAIVTKPKLAPIEITFNVVLRTGVTISASALASQLMTVISDYVDSIPMGGTVSLYDVLHYAQSNSNISQAYINSLYVDGEAAIVGSEYSLDWDTRAYIKNVTVLI